MQRNGGSPPACASCKHQRKRCSENCFLAPYFPAERRAQFDAVHAVFGVSNLTKMLKRLGSREERVRAVESLVWEAEWRQRDKVTGHFGEYQRLLHDYQVLWNKLLMMRCHTCDLPVGISHGYGNNQNNGNHINYMTGNSHRNNANLSMRRSHPPPPEEQCQHELVDHMHRSLHADQMNKFKQHYYLQGQVLMPHMG